MSEISIDVRKANEDIAEFLDKVGNNNKEIASKTIDKIGYTIERGVKEEAKYRKRTGYYLRSIKYRREGRLSGSVASTSRVAVYLEVGARPHRITARRKRVLRFVSHGATLFRRSVFHPGNPPYEIFKKGLKSVEGKLKDVINQAYKDLGKGI